ncbi:MAG: oligosaccharide flippase family protein [bacterium]
MNRLKQLFLKYFKGSDYRKNVITMVSGRIVAQVIPILITPLLTRIYSPEEFGIFAVYNSIVTIVSMMSNGRYCLAVILPKKDKNAHDLIFLSSVLSIFSSTVFYLFLLFLGNKLFGLLDSSVLEKYSFLIFSNILFIALHEAFFYEGLRNRKYKILAWDVISYALVMVASRLSLGYLGYTESGLLMSYSIAYTFSFIFLFVALRGRKIFVSADLQNVLKLAKKYIKFPKFSLFADSLNMTAQMAPNILLNALFGSISAGYFSMSDKVLGSPIWLVTMGVGDVFKQEASQQIREKGSCTDVFMKTARSMFILGIVPFSLLFVTAPVIVPYIFGSNWEPVGQYIQIFALMYFAKFVITPVTYIVYIISKQNYNILFQGLKFVSMIIAFGVGFYRDNLALGLILWSLLTTLSYIIMFVISYKLSISEKLFEE